MCAYHFVSTGQQQRYVGTQSSRGQHGDWNLRGPVFVFVFVFVFFFFQKKKMFKKIFRATYTPFYRIQSTSFSIPEIFCSHRWTPLGVG